MSDLWPDQEPQRRKCQFCKQERDCKHGPDPFLFYNFDEDEMVWLCSECYSIRESGLHLPESEVDV
jgi:hypothetical protein